MADNNELVLLTAGIVEAYVASNSVGASAVPEVIATTYAALAAASRGTTDEPSVPEYTPAVTARRSLASREHIVSMIDGKPYRTLRKHLTANGLSAEEYRERYGLPSSYPMVAPAYSEKRSAMAKALGLGRRPGKK